MKIGIYTDSHYSSQAVTVGIRHNSQSLRKIKEAYDFFKKEDCQLIVCLGDLIDTETTEKKEIENLTEIAKVIGKSDILTVCIMGNHDSFALDRNRFYEILGITPADRLYLGGKRLLFLDACYFKNGRRYAPGDSDWTDAFLPNAEKLRGILAEPAAGDTYIFIHQNIDPAVRADHRIFNAHEIFTLINESGKVKAVFQGHYHPGCNSEYNSVKYITLPAMCENENAFWVYEI